MVTTPNKINPRVMACCFDDAHQNIDSVIEKMDTPESYEDEILAMAIWYDLVNSSFCRSWHRRWMTDSMVDRLTQEEFELFGRSVPLWNPRFEIVSLIPSHPVEGPPPGQELVQAKISAVHWLQKSQAMIDRIWEKAQKQSEIKMFDAESAPLYRDAVAGLCRAWYSRYGYYVDVREGDTAEENAAEFHIPDWGSMTSTPLRLVGLDWITETAC